MRPFGVHHASTKLVFSPVGGGIREPVNEGNTLSMAEKPDTTTLVLTA